MLLKAFYYLCLPINLKLQYPLPPLGNPWAFSVVHAWGKGCGKFEPCLAGVRNLNRECQVFFSRILVLYLEI